MPTRTYDPSEVSVAVGVSLLTGWNLIRITREEDGVLFSVGTSGEVSRSINHNKLGTITLIYPQTALENQSLSLLEVSKATLSVTVIDKSGTTVAIMEFGTIVKPPDSELGKEAGTREWMLRGDLPVFNVGGNNLET